MAIRERKDCARKWQVYWTNPFTKKRESVFCESLPEAQKTDAQIKFKLRWEKESFRPAEANNKEEVVNNTLGGVIYAYLRERQMHRTSMRSTLARLKNAIDRLGNTDISSITELDLGRLQVAISATGIKPIQVRMKMRSLKTVFIWAHKRKLIKSIPDWPDPPTGTFEHFIPPTQDEIARILEAAPPHIQRVVIIATRCGCRVGSCELFKLKWSDVDWTRSVITVHAARKNLSEPMREIPIRSDILPILKRWHADDMKLGAEYICHFRGRQIGRICNSWKTTLRRAGITRRIRPYDMRHAFATELIAAGADLGTVAKLMGHSNVQTVLASYQHVMTSQKVAAIESLPELPMCHNLCATNEISVLQ